MSNLALQKSSGGRRMNGSDKYYLKKGKLELSILDDEEEVASFRDRSKVKEPRIKLTEDIYNTLHTMGQFLTRQVGNNEEGAAKKENEKEDEDFFEGPEERLAPKWKKTDKNEQKFVGLQGRALEETVKSMYQQAAEQAEQLHLTPTDILKENEASMVGVKDEEVVDLSATVMLEAITDLQEGASIETQIVGEEMLSETREEAVITRHKPTIFEDDEEQEEELGQSKIDEILLTFFGESHPQYEYTKRLKRHIDKKIYEIENYQ